MRSSNKRRYWNRCRRPSCWAPRNFLHTFHISIVPPNRIYIYAFICPLCVLVISATVEWAQNGKFRCFFYFDLSSASEIGRKWKEVLFLVVNHVSLIAYIDIGQTIWPYWCFSLDPIHTRRMLKEWNMSYSVLCACLVTHFLMEPWRVPIVGSFGDTNARMRIIHK